MNRDEILEILNDEEKFNEGCRAAFDELDTDKSGQLERAEFAVCLVNLAKDFGIAAPSSKEIDETLAKLDTDKSGALSLSEFKEHARQLLNTLLASA